ncbi:hypothetical protein [Nocardia sp. NPDC052566]|uniref:hypothetical protein n=1 Tax=Nocardia sp. NPDC052566 TaxID=3364330 RepID=UPI0037C9B721
MNAISRLAVGTLLTGAALLSITPAYAAPENTGSSGGTPSAPTETTPAKPALALPPAPDGSSDPLGSSSGTNSGKCSGWVSFEGSFTASTSLTAKVWGDKVESEKHAFDFGGYLDGAENAPAIGTRGGKWIIYRSNKFDLAVPYVKGAGLYLHKNDTTAFPEWDKLCDY